MVIPDLLEVPAASDGLGQLDPLPLKHIHLEVAVNVVNQEAHMLSELHRLLEDWLVVKVLHRTHFRAPYMLQLTLNPLDWEQKPEENIVFFNDVC